MEVASIAIGVARLLTLVLQEISWQITFMKESQREDFQSGKT
jgi:hypothetical protein